MMRPIQFLSLILMVGTLATSHAEEVPLFETLGDHTRVVRTQSPKAQQYFDQGLRFLFGFNHGMAIRSFQEAARLDPECAMAHWGIALACGPHINFPEVPPERAKLAWEELSLAVQLHERATPANRALIQALRARYADPQPEDRSPLDQAYAEAMREVWKAHPRDGDVGLCLPRRLWTCVLGISGRLRASLNPGRKRCWPRSTPC